MSLDILFYILGGLTIGTALMVVLSKHPVRSVLYLVLTFFLISANYVLMNAQFIAIVNIIVYAGAIMVLFLFVLMLLNLNKENEPKHSPMMTIGAGIAGGALFLVVVAAMRDAILATPMIDANSEQVGLVENLGKVLFTKYVLPFEVSSILFLAAMVGAVLLAKKEKQTID
ncbi:NADH-quinone oxidoreductase subunit J family protein [Fluviicola sp.]|uniref:NADH-quinone oxidoreductase subunit J family protein n=1 Tax=Fluviicola sp. TaxID=1917219 RepID=UPI003D267E84